MSSNTATIVAVFGAIGVVLTAWFQYRSSILKTRVDQTVTAFQGYKDLVANLQSVVHDNQGQIDELMRELDRTRRDLMQAEKALEGAKTALESAMSQLSQKDMLIEALRAAKGVLSPRRT